MGVQDLLQDIEDARYVNLPSITVTLLRLTGRKQVRKREFFRGLDQRNAEAEGREENKRVQKVSWWMGVAALDLTGGFKVDKVERARKLKLAQRGMLLLSLLNLERNTMLLKLDDMADDATRYQLASDGIPRIRNLTSIRACSTVDGMEEPDTESIAQFKRVVGYLPTIGPCVMLSHVVGVASKALAAAI